MASNGAGLLLSIECRWWWLLVKMSCGICCSHSFMPLDWWLEQEITLRVSRLVLVVVQCDMSNLNMPWSPPILLSPAYYAP